MTLKEIGERCKEHRERLGKCQYDVAHDTGYSKENVSAFETGRNNNAIIFNWYVERGLIEYLYLSNKAPTSIYGMKCERGATNGKDV